MLICCSLIWETQDDVNVPGCPIALGFTLEKLSAHTIDEAGKEVFVHKNALDLLRKVANFLARQISLFCVSFGG